MKRKKRLNKHLHQDTVARPYYHEEMTYDSMNENWPGVFSLLLIPLFIFIFGWGLLSLFRYPSSSAPISNGGSPPVKQDQVNGFEVGVGGGPGLTITPTPPIQKLQNSSEHLQPIQ